MSDVDKHTANTQHLHLQSMAILCYIEPDESIDMELTDIEPRA